LEKNLHGQPCFYETRGDHTKQRQKSGTDEHPVFEYQKLMARMHDSLQIILAKLQRKKR